MNVGGELQGADVMVRALEQIEGNVARKIVRTALRAGAHVIARELAATAPSAELRAAIKVRAGKRSRTGQSMLVTLSSTGFPGGVFWVGFYNYGHQIGRRLKAAAAKVLTKLKLKHADVGLADNRGRVKGEHWLDMGFRRAEPMARQVISETLRQGLAEEAANSGAKK